MNTSNFEEIFRLFQELAQTLAGKNGQRKYIWVRNLIDWYVLLQRAPLINWIANCLALVLIKFHILNGCVLVASFFFLILRLGHG